MEACYSASGLPSLLSKPSAEQFQAVRIVSGALRCWREDTPKTYLWKPGMEKHRRPALIVTAEGIVSSIVRFIVLSHIFISKPH